MDRRLQFMAETKNKIVRTTLDRLPFGSKENGYDDPTAKIKGLPENVTARDMLGDVIRIAWPSMVELLLTQLASMVDLIMVGTLGTWALTAVGLTTQPKFLLMTAFMALTVGATAMIARYKGAGDQKSANMIMRQALVLVAIFSTLAAVAGFIFAEPMIIFMGAAEQQVLEGSTAYLKIQMIGFPFLALTSCVTASLRGTGDSKTAMIYNALANVVNVVFNWLLIYGNLGFPQMGVAGASLATVIGQCTAFVFAFAVAIKGRRYIQLSFKESFKLKKEPIMQIVRIGFPAMVEQLIMRFGNVIYNRSIASLGTTAYATHQVCMNIQTFAFMNGQAFATSATSLVGQSLGKRRYDMAQHYASFTQKISMCVAIVIGVGFFLGGRWLCSLYSDDPLVISTGATIMMMVALMQPLHASQFVLAGALRGAGDTKATAAITFITVAFMRTGLTLLVVYVLNWGLVGAWGGFVADQTVRSLLVFLRYHSGKWKVIAHKMKTGIPGGDPVPEGD